MELKKQLGKNIKKYRKLNHQTQEQLAEAIGVEVISVSSIETGRYFPAPENLVKISEALNVSLADLFNFKEQMNCDDYINEITGNLEFIKKDETKLLAINEFIKSLI